MAVFDDVQLPMVADFVETFLVHDPRWERLASTGKWIAFRRLSEGPLAEGEWEQAFYPRLAAPLRQRARSRVATVLPPGLRRRLAGSVGGSRR